MSKINQIWKNKHLILEGLKNKIFTKEHIEEIHNERLAICNKCPYIDRKGNFCTMPGTEPCCSQCGCSLSLKLRSLGSSCPLEQPKWEAITDVETANKIKQQINENL